MPDGVSYRSVWESGQGGARSRLGAPQRRIPGGTSRAGGHAQAYTDRPRNQQFIKDDDAFRSFVYDQDVTPSAIRIRLASKDLLEAWKGNAVIPEKFKFFEEASQFAPALLVVEVVNEAAQAIQFVGGYVEVEESYTDLQPFLEFTPPWGNCGDQGAFEPEFELTNYGWGGVKDAKATYGFGRNPAADANFVADVCSFDATAKVSALDGLRRSGVNIDRLKRGGFKCSSAQVPACTSQLLSTGILGRIGASIIRRKPPC